MKRFFLALTSIPPFATLWIYVQLITADLALLDANGKYIPRPGAAIEDVIGFGYWLTWAVVTVVFASLSLLAFGVGQRAKWYWIPLLAAFLLLTVIGSYYAAIVECQVSRTC